MTIECKRNPTLKAISLCCFRCCRPHRYLRARTSQRRSLFFFFAPTQCWRIFLLCKPTLLQRRGVVKGLRKMSKLSQFPPQTKCNQFESSTMASANGTKCAESGPCRVRVDVEWQPCMYVFVREAWRWWACGRHSAKSQLCEMHLRFTALKCTCRTRLSVAVRADFRITAVCGMQSLKNARKRKRLKRLQCPKQSHGQSNNNMRG